MLWCGSLACCCLDEPSLGLAPLIVRQILDTVADLATHGAAVLLAEQNAAAVLRVANRGVIIANGRVVREDAARVLLDGDDVGRRYLGVAAVDVAAAPVRRMDVVLDRIDLRHAGPADPHARS